MANNQDKRKIRVFRQAWKPGAWLLLLKGVWTASYSIIKILLGALATVILIAGVCLLVFVGILGDYLENDILPNADAQLDNLLLDKTSYAYYIDSNGNIQTLQKLHADVKQEWVEYEDIPKDLIHAAVAIEDHRFFEHQGVDWITTVKACANMFIGAKDEFGGSSITQQLIKNYFQADDVTVQRKVLEIFRATELEKRYDKTVIMEYYLNIIYLGQRCNGVKAAAATYFGKELEHLTTAECAAMISITNNPSLYNPYRESLDNDGLTGMERNKERRTNTLWRMRNLGYLEEEEYRKALDEEIVLKRGIDPEDKVADCPNETCAYHGKVGTFDKHEDGKYYCPKCGGLTTIGENASQEVYSYFMDTVLEDVAQALAEKEGTEWNSDTKKIYMERISRSGYHIYTTLDMNVQKQVDKIYTDLTQIPADKSLQQLQSAMVVIDNRTGNIVAMAGGVGEKDVHDGLNRATDSKLQPGSSMKPLAVYAPAFELGIMTPATVIKDMPLNYIGDDPNNQRPFPYNDNREYTYSQTILEGIKRSINAISVNTLDTIGTGYSFDFAKNKFGLSTLVKDYVNSQGKHFTDEEIAPLGMGAPTLGVTVRDMTEAYASFANNGVRREGRTFTKVYDSDGKLVLDNTQDSQDILSDKAVNYVNYCLSQAVLNGTGGEAFLGNHMNVAGKTGTTASAKDRWFCGYTPYYTAAVWCGYDTPEVISMVYGGNPAAQLWKKVMEPLHRNKTNLSLYSTEDMVKVNVCLDCGKLATDACTMDVRPQTVYGGRVSKPVWVYEEDAPLDECECHVIVDFCEECEAVANDYCKKLAEVGEVTLTKRSLVQMTEADVDDIADAIGKGLMDAYTKDNCVYLVDANGEPLNTYKGFSGELNKDVDAPYIVCTEHTKKDWDDYVKLHPDIEEPEEDEDEPNDDPTTTPSEPEETKPEEEENDSIWDIFDKIFGGNT